MTVFATRDYQDRCLEAIDGARHVGCRRQLVAMATGLGKTVVISNLPRIGLRRLLVVAHREELLDQAADKLRHWNPGMRVDVDQADRYAPLAANLFETPDFYAICASVATIGRKGSSRLTRFPRDYFDAVIPDEAHHAVATSYRTVFDHFGAGEPGGPLLVGFTATPSRGDGGDLSKVFDKIVYSFDLPSAIERGFLVDIRAVAIDTKTELDGVKATREDFVAGELEDAVNTRGRNGLIVKGYLERAVGRKAIVFAAGVQHSKDLAETFLSAGVAAEHIDGTTPRDERKRTLARFRSGETLVLVNVGVLTEGFDEPSCSCVILARPTKSGVLFQQMVGRGTRLFEGKTDLLIIDVEDLSSQHTLCSTAALFGLPTGLNLEGRSARDARKAVDELVQLEIPYEEIKKARTFADLEKLKVRYREINMFWKPEPAAAVKGISRLTWISIGDTDVSLNAGDFRAFVRIDLLGHARLIAVRCVEGEDEDGMKSSRDVRVIDQEFSTIAEAIVKGDELARESAPAHLVNPDASWRRKPASVKQLAILRRRAVPFREGITSGEASVLLAKVFAQRGARASIGGSF